MDDNKPNETVAIGIRIPQDLKAEVLREAKKRRWSMNTLALAAIEEFVEKSKQGELA